MPVRMTGMISGMDTESLIKSMVDAQRLKNKKTTDKSTLLEWKQDKWKELNTKLFKLYQEDLSKLRLQGNYGAKKVTTSNDSLVSVKGGSNAPTGTSTLEIISTATSQGVTSGTLGAGVKGNTKLSDLAGSGFVEGNEIIITNGSKEKVLTVGKNTTIDDYIAAIKSVDLNANYDTTQQRIFISSKESGENNKFTITQYAGGTKDLRDNIKNMLGYDSLSDEKKKEVLDALATSDRGVLENLIKEKVTKDEIASLRGEAGEEVLQSISNKLLESGTKKEVVQEYFRELERNVIRAELKAELKAKIDSGELIVPEDEEEYLQFEEQYLAEELAKPENITRVQDAAEKIYGSFIESDYDAQLRNLAQKEYNSTEKHPEDETQTKAQYYKAQLEAVYNSKDPEAKIAEAWDAKKQEFDGIMNAHTNNASGTPDILAALKMGNVTGETVVGDEDSMTVQRANQAVIKYNGVTMNSDSNTFNVNGLEITVKGSTQSGEKINLNVANDTQATYDMVKKFVTSYNEILKEINELYYAPSAKGYDPLSDDEKEAMSEKQIDKWEDKIKSSVLRRDDTLGSVLSTLNTAIMSTVEVDGKRYSLSSFGIGTSSDYTEKGLLHIDGDADDALTSSLTNKLMQALEEDSELVGKVISGITKNLYDEMGKKMKAIPNVRSASTFYNDKTMSKQQEDYQKKIKELENKLVTIENKYYKQFAAMESALSKLQSQTNALAGMLGTNQNQ